MGGVADDIISVTTLGLVDTDFAGDEAAKAAERAAGAQVAQADKAIASQETAQARLEERMLPYEQAGAQGISPLLDSILNPQDTSVGAQEVIDNPFFKALAEDQERRLMASQAARGKLGSGETEDSLMRNVLLLGNQFQQQQQQQQKQDELNQIQNLFGLTQLGQQSAAGVGSAGIQTAQNVGNLFTQIGNAQAAGKIGAQNARDQAFNQLTSLAGQGIGMLAGMG
jgi:hypothetical protein